MIKRLVQVKNYRIFQEWAPDAGATEFRRINLIYGVNGSGKSTLASVLANAKFDTNWDSGLSLVVENKSNQHEEIKNHGHVFWDDVRIFDRNYIKDNLQFDYDGNSYALPLVRVGKENIDRDDTIAVLEVKKSDTTQQILKSHENVQNSKKNLEKLSRDTADIISQELSVLGGRYERRSYTAVQVKQLIGQKLIGVESEFVTESLEMINSPKYASHMLPDNKILSTLNVMNRTKEIVSRTATSVVIKTLKDDPKKGEWVQKGLDLNSANEDCVFCGNTISEERITHLGQHFNESLKSLQFDIDETLIEISLLESNLESTKEMLPRITDILPELRNQYGIALNTLIESLDEIFEHLKKLRERLEYKRLKLFDSLELPSYLQLVVTADMNLLFLLVQKHNELLSTFERTVNERAVQIEHTRVLAIQDEYLDITSNLQRENAEILNLESVVKDVDLELSRLNLDGTDPISLATEMNAELAQLLGRDELFFTYIKEGRYSIERSGEPALFLSEGEKSVISLIYFLKSLDAADCDKSNTVVLIDDPISSLDSNFTVALSAYIWAGLVAKKSNKEQCKQLFLLTHNFELFRSWCNQLKKVKRLKGKYLILELRTRVTSNPDGKFVRKPFFLEWPEDLGKMRLTSEYHFLFWRVAEALKNYSDVQTIESEIEAAAILPNVCRRLLEGFLGFKYPSNVGDFFGLLNAASEDIEDPVTRNRLHTFLNEYSHYEEGDTTKPINRPEAISVLKAVFELMNEVDPDHYTKMCEALKIDLVPIS